MTTNPARIEQQAAFEDRIQKELTKGNRKKKAAIAAKQLALIVIASALLVLWQNLLGVKVEGTMVARTGYTIGMILFALLVCKRGNR